MNDNLSRNSYLTAFQMIPVLTEADWYVLEKLRIPYVLGTTDDGCEALFYKHGDTHRINGKSVSTLVKKGTIRRLVDLGVIISRGKYLGKNWYTISEKGERVFANSYTGEKDYLS